MATGVCIAAPLLGDRSGRQEARERGFSLIEMMVVIGIMSIILAIALPAYSHWRASTALQSASETLMAHIKQARVMAVSGNRSVSIAFTSSSYTLDSGGSNPLTFALSDYTKNLTLSSTFASNTLTFASNGVTNVSANKDSVTLTNANGTSRTISVNIVGRAYYN